MSSFHATTIFAVQHKGKSAMSGDGQVTFGQAVVMKHTARKVRKLFNGKVLAGFAGSVADAFTLFEMFEAKLEEYNGNLKRASVELAKEWRSDKVLRKLEAMLIVMNQDTLLLVSGTGEVIEPDDGIMAIGSGGKLRPVSRKSAENLCRREPVRQRYCTCRFENRGRDLCVHKRSDHFGRT